MTTPKEDIDEAVEKNAMLAFQIAAAWKRGNAGRARVLLEKQIQQMSILRANLFSAEGDEQ